MAKGKAAVPMEPEVPSSPTLCKLCGTSIQREFHTLRRQTATPSYRMPWVKQDSPSRLTHISLRAGTRTRFRVNLYHITRLTEFLALISRGMSREDLVVSKLVRWSIVSVVVIFVLLILVRSHYVLDSRSLETAINAELPKGDIQDQSNSVCEKEAAYVLGRPRGHT